LLVVSPKDIWDNPTPPPVLLTRVKVDDRPVALRDSRSLTREELGVALTEAGIAATGMRLGYIIHRAELDAVLCSGPRRGKQFTYMLVAERAPNARVLAPDEALGELTRRYFAGHGPATAHDFAWWSGLAVADAKRGLEMVKSELVSEEIEGATYWFLPAEPWARRDDTPALLLPTYDEFFMGFTGKSRAAGPDPKELLFDSTIVLDGEIAGTWRRTFQKSAAVVEVKTVAGLPAGDGKLAAAAERLGAFLEMPVELREVDEQALKTTGWKHSRLRNRELAEANDR
jgi:hypothetical protein